MNRVANLRKKRVAKSEEKGQKRVAKEEKIGLQLKVKEGCKLKTGQPTWAYDLVND